VAEAADLGVVTAEAIRLGRPLAIVERDATLEVFGRRGEVRRPQAVASHRVVALNQESIGTRLLPQAKQLPGQRGSRLQVSPDAVEGLAATDHPQTPPTV